MKSEPIMVSLTRTELAVLVSLLRKTYVNNAESAPKLVALASKLEKCRVA